MEKRRIEYIDLSKGLCISLVLLFHINCFGTTLEAAAQHFRMPLYYFLSGIFFKEYEGILSFSIKKINKLIIPYLFFFFIAYFTGILCYYLVFYEKGIIEEPFRWNMIFDIFTKLSQGENIGYNSPTWFLISLFEVNILFYLLRINIRKDKILLLISFIIGINAIIFDLNRLPYFFDRSLINLPFFAVGYYCRKLILGSTKICKYWLLLFSVVCFVILYCFSILPKDIRYSFYLYYFLGLLGIAAMLSISRFLTRLPLISYIGRYSLIVLGFHTFLVGPMRYIYSSTSEFIQYILSFVSIIILMRFIIIPISIRLFPYFTAQKDLISYPLKWKNCIKK